MYGNQYVLKVPTNADQSTFGLFFCCHFGLFLGVNYSNKR